MDALDRISKLEVHREHHDRAVTDIKGICDRVEIRLRHVERNMWIAAGALGTLQFLLTHFAR